MGSASRRRIEVATVSESRAGFTACSARASRGSSTARSLGFSALLGLVLFARASVGCSSNHHVSPWGTANGPQLGVYVEQPDLKTHLTEIDRETESLGMSLDREVTVDIKGAKFVARAYSGRDAVGRTTHACRIATPFGVVLAAGPLSGPLRRAATELVPHEGEASVFQPLTDFAGTGALEVMLRAEDGRLEVWKIESRGSLEMEVEMEVVPTEASDIDDDGHADLGGSMLVRDTDLLKPSLTDVATLSDGRYSNRSKAALAWHAHERDVHRPKESDLPEAKTRAAIEVAWHSILAGDNRKKALDELARTKPPSDLKAPFATYVLRIERIDEEPRGETPKRPAR